MTRLAHLRALRLARDNVVDRKPLLRRVALRTPVVAAQLREGRPGRQPEAG
jgi:hypothetical protein